MTSCHAENYKLKAKLEATEMRILKKTNKQRKKTKQAQLPKGNPFTGTMKFYGICSIFKIAFLQ